MLVFEAVTLRYPGQKRPVLDAIDLVLHEGEFAFLTGDSGAGKTSLLRLIYGAVRPNGGSVRLDGRPLTHIPGHLLRRRLGVVFQDNRLLPHKTVWENVAFAAEILGRRPAEVRERARHLLEQVGLGDKLPRRPQELSAGERQRVAIARALMNEPRLVLADEPTGNLDPANTRLIFDLLLEFNRQTGTACLVATHAREQIDAYPVRVLHLSDGRLHERAAPPSIRSAGGGAPRGGGDG
ncbi:MAG TPA: ATP-binding cassette domain-containing protein [Bacillota bacterium]